MDRQQALHQAWGKLTDQEKNNSKKLFDLIADEDTAIEKAAADGASDCISSAMTTVKGMIKAKEEVLCGFCKGWGHIPKQCSTLRSMNKATRDTPSLRAAWGNMKSNYLSSAA